MPKAQSKPAAVATVPAPALSKAQKAGRLATLDVAARYMAVNGMVKGRERHDPGLFGIQVQAPKVMSEETKERLRALGGRTAKPTGPPRKVGSGAFIRKLLGEGKLSEEAILKAMQKEFPESKATIKDVKWNKAQMGKGRF